MSKKINWENRYIWFFIAEVLGIIGFILMVIWLGLKFYKMITV